MTRVEKIWTGVGVLTAIGVIVAAVVESNKKSSPVSATGPCPPNCVVGKQLNDVQLAAGPNPALTMPAGTFVNVYSSNVIYRADDPLDGQPNDPIAYLQPEGATTPASITASNTVKGAVVITFWLQDSTQATLPVNVV
jgi:hypothetical protein